MNLKKMKDNLNEPLLAKSSAEDRKTENSNNDHRKTENSNNDQTENSDDLLLSKILLYVPAMVILMSLAFLGFSENFSREFKWIPKIAFNSWDGTDLKKLFPEKGVIISSEEVTRSDIFFKLIFPIFRRSWYSPSISGSVDEIRNGLPVLWSATCNCPHDVPSPFLWIHAFGMANWIPSFFIQAITGSIGIITLLLWKKQKSSGGVLILQDYYNSNYSTTNSSTIITTKKMENSITKNEKSITRSENSITENPEGKIMVAVSNGVEKSLQSSNKSRIFNFLFRNRRFFLRLHKYLGYVFFLFLFFSLSAAALPWQFSIGAPPTSPVFWFTECLYLGGVINLGLAILAVASSNNKKHGQHIQKHLDYLLMSTMWICDPGLHRCVFWSWYYFIVFPQIIMTPEIIINSTVRSNNRVSNNRVVSNTSNNIVSESISNNISLKNAGFGNMESGSLVQNQTLLLQLLGSHSKEPVYYNTNEEDIKILQNMAFINPHSKAEQTGKKPCRIGERAMQRMEGRRKQEQSEREQLLANYDVFPRFLEGLDNDTKKRIFKHYYDGTRKDLPVIFPVINGKAILLDGDSTLGDSTSDKKRVDDNTHKSVDKRVDDNTHESVESVDALNALKNLNDITNMTSKNNNSRDNDRRDDRVNSLMGGLERNSVTGNTTLTVSGNKLTVTKTSTLTLPAPAFPLNTTLKLPPSSLYNVIQALNSNTDYYINIRGTNASLGPFSSPQYAEKYYQDLSSNFTTFDFADIRSMFVANYIQYYGPSLGEDMTSVGGDITSLGEDIIPSGNNLLSDRLSDRLSSDRLSSDRLSSDREVEIRITDLVSNQHIVLSQKSIDELALANADDPRTQIYEFFVQNYGKMTVELGLFIICGIFAVCGQWRREYEVKYSKESNSNSKESNSNNDSSNSCNRNEQKISDNRNEHRTSSNRNDQTISGNRNDQTISDNRNDECHHSLLSNFFHFLREKPILGVNFTLRLIIMFFIGLGNLLMPLWNNIWHSVVGSLEVFFDFNSELSPSLSGRFPSADAIRKASSPTSASLCLTIYGLLHVVIYIYVWCWFLRAYGKWGRKV